MKSQLFKTAWRLVKEMKMNFSDALKLSWKSYKNNATVVINKAWNGTIGVAFKIKNCTGSTIERAIELVKNSIPLDNSGASFYYDGKTFNND